MRVIGTLFLLVLGAIAVFVVVIVSSDRRSHAVAAQCEADIIRVRLMLQSPSERATELEHRYFRQCMRAQYFEYRWADAFESCRVPQLPGPACFRPIWWWELR
jgi:hypothetical protein